MKKKLLTALLATTLVLSNATSAFAAYVSDQGGTITDASGNNVPVTDGHTQFGVQTVLSANADAIKNVVFEVPLYVGMVIVTGQNDVLTPSNYYIRNLSRKPAAGGGSATEYKIQVSKVEFSTLKNSTFSLVSSAPASKNQMKLTVGGLTPAISSPGSSVAFFGTSPAPSGGGTLLAPNVVFSEASGGTHKLKAINYNDTLNIPITATVKGSDHTAATAGAAQLKVVYTVDPIVTNGSNSTPISAATVSDTKPW